MTKCGCLCETQSNKALDDAVSIALVKRLVDEI